MSENKNVNRIDKKKERMLSGKPPFWKFVVSIVGIVLAILLFIGVFGYQYYTQKMVSQETSEINSVQGETNFVYSGNRNQFEELISTKKTVFVMFYKEDCNTCHLVDPVVSKLAKENKFEFIQVSVKQDRSFVKEYDLTVVPTIMKIQNGKVVDRIEGNQEDFSSFFLK